MNIFESTIPSLSSFPDLKVRNSGILIKLPNWQLYGLFGTENTVSFVFNVIFLCRERARRMNCAPGSVGLSLVQLGGGRNSRYPSFGRPGRERPSLDLDTVLEERSDAEQTQVNLHK